MNQIQLNCFLFLSLVFIGCKDNKKEKEFYPNGTIKSEYSTVDNKIEGRFKTYYPSGILAYESNIKNGLREGLEVAYYENGKVKMKGNCNQDKEYGFYLYYNQDGKVDSIIEYVSINDNSPVESYLHPQKFSSKDVVVNRRLIYNKKGKVDSLKSVYFTVDFYKDTIKIGDTLHVAVNFHLQSNSTPNKFEVYFYDESIGKLIIKKSTKGQKILFYNKVAIRKGVNNVKGVIEESIGDKKYNYLFFNNAYYVL